eukprot:m.405408 g.405408  ORF g.405408 m.405408 type:complete len:596 (+) comp21206_c0_seq4:628-2415(+)
MISKYLCTVVSLVCFAVVCGHLDGGSQSAPLPTPPRGYSTWNYFPYKAISEEACYKMADALVAKGLVASGFSVFVVDEPCFVGRDPQTGELIENVTTWPNGLKAFAAHLAKNGMELGIYTDAGPLTCQQCPGSFGHEKQDMETFMKWGATYVKIDRCFGVDNNEMRMDLPQTFAKYRAAASDAVQISAILAATDNCWEWCNGTCQHCRTTGDIRNSFDSMAGHVNAQSSIPYISYFAGPGYFNDLDMLVIGVNGTGPYAGGLTVEESKSHLALWSILKSPLLISADVTALNTQLVQLLTNHGARSVHQDALAVQARRVQQAQTSVDPSVTFDGCTVSGMDIATDPGQMWKVVDTVDKIHPDSIAQELRTVQIQSTLNGRCLATATCDSQSSRVTTCACEYSATDINPQCRNASCASSSRMWQIPSTRATASSVQVLSSASGMCLEGMLGPQRSFVATNPCAANKSNVKQLWFISDDGHGTIAAYDHDNISSSVSVLGASTRLTQCLTAFNGSNLPSTCDVFVGPLVGSQHAVAVFNHATTVAITALNLTSILPFDAGTRIQVKEVFTGEILGDFVDSMSVTTSSHGTSFMIMSQA